MSHFPFDVFETLPTLSAQGPRVDLIFFDAGGGHRAATSALSSVLSQRWRGSRIRALNLRDLLEPMDIIRRIARVRIEDLYNGLLLQRGLTLGTGPMLRTTQMLIRCLHRRETELLARFWEHQPADLVITLIPNFNRAIFHGLRAADGSLNRKPTPMVTILTDLADYPPHFWMERQEQYFVCGTDQAVRQAIAMGHPKDRVFRASGMIVRPEFYSQPEVSVGTERLRLGLRPDLPTGLVSFGGYGSRRMLTVARRTAAAGLKTQFIFLCGRNERLQRHLEELKLPYPFHVEGFTSNLPYFMRLADYFVGKAGPGSISEALVMGLPVIVERNSWTMVQERFNADWISKNQVGIALHSFAEIAAGILPMLDSERLWQYRQRARAMHNRAVFEIPEILTEILSRDPLRSAAPERSEDEEPSPCRPLETLTAHQ